ncbi:MAG: prepilin-type N-terminal cleavage/methylation domain-containing protein [Gammaproteobacteria bacterium]|jgi:prepilin-type N-terminal cleavage/methylation domain-containing protein|nr:prepilin-type N-terminal cleavage/methylation domain-containing protein [Gammaproteobacteria bacterium]
MATMVELERTKTLPIGRHPKGISGFTLLELLIVTTLLAALSTLVVNRIGSGESRELQSQIRSIVSSLKQARRKAVISGKTITYRNSEIAPAVSIDFFPMGGSSGATIHLSHKTKSAVIFVDTITGQINHHFNKTSP